MSIYALKPNTGDPKWVSTVYQYLLKGVARFGWSYVKTADLHSLTEKIQKEGWNNLSQDEKNCYKYYLLRIQEGDYIVYINTPKQGQCTLAKVSKPYYFDWHEDLESDAGFDGNHCLGVDPTSVKVFERNGTNVHPYLRRRLSLQGKYYQIYAEKEFEYLLNSLDTTKEVTKLKSNIDFLKYDLEDVLDKITQKIHASHPGKDLERLISRVFEKMPNVKVQNNGSGFRTDHGADLIVTISTSLDDFNFESFEKRLVVQVKSYEGSHNSLLAVQDIEKAINEYNADMGLIVTTAQKTDKLECEIENLSLKLNKPISLCAGKDVARLVIKYLKDEIF